MRRCEALSKEERWVIGEPWLLKAGTDVEANGVILRGLARQLCDALYIVGFVFFFLFSLKALVLPSEQFFFFRTVWVLKIGTLMGGMHGSPSWSG